MLRRLFGNDEAEPDRDTDVIADEWYDAKYDGAPPEQLAAIDARWRAALAEEQPATPTTVRGWLANLLGR